MRKYINKLVRDKIPDLIKEDNKKCWTYKMKDDLIFTIALLNKIKEETKELGEALESLDRDKIIDNFVDLYEVLDALKKVYNISDLEIELNQHRKEANKGSFNNRIYLDFVEENE